MHASGRMPQPGRDDRPGPHAAIVTGAGSREGTEYPNVGVGAACAVTLAARGVQVALVDRDAKALDRTLDWAGGHSGLLPVVADVREEDDCRRAVDEAAARFGGLGLLVNNAGITGAPGAPGTVVDTSLPVWQDVLSVNLTSVLLMSKYAIPVMVSGGGGSIVNVSSIGAIRGYGSTGYAASKGGMVSLGTSMAYAHGRDGIRVNTVLPGHLATPMGNAGGHDGGLRESASMLGTEGTAWDVADAVAFLASDAARWITAVALPVDGGASMATGLAMFKYMNAREER